METRVSYSTVLNVQRTQPGRREIHSDWFLEASCESVFHAVWRILSQHSLYRRTPWLLPNGTAVFSLRYWQKYRFIQICKQYDWPKKNLSILCNEGLISAEEDMNGNVLSSRWISMFRKLFCLGFFFKLRCRSRAVGAGLEIYRLDDQLTICCEVFSDSEGRSRPCQRTRRSKEVLLACEYY